MQYHCQPNVELIDTMEYQVLYTNSFQSVKNITCIGNLYIKLNLSYRTFTWIYQTLNAFHAAGECRWHVKNVTKFVKNVKNVEFHDHIWNHNEKCIQISTNMPRVLSIKELAWAIIYIKELVWTLKVSKLSQKQRARHLFITLYPFHSLTQFVNNSSSLVPTLR